MKRSTGMAVLVSAGVLIAAGELPALRAGAVLDAGRSGLAAMATSSARAWDEVRGAWSAPRVARPPVVRPVFRTPPPLAPTLLLATPRRIGPPAFPRDLPLSVLAAASAGVLAALAALAWLALSLRPGRSRDRVFRLARRGLPAAGIARSVRVPQDAVRTLLTPGLGVRR